MATKRKPTASKTKAVSKKKKTASAPAKKASAAAKKPVAHKPVPARASAAKPAKAGKHAVAGKPVAAGKPAMAGKPAKGAPLAGTAKAGAVAKPVKGGKPSRPVGRLKVVSATPPVVRPIGQLPPEALARAVKAPPPMALRPARVVAPVRKPAPEPVSDQGANGVTEKDHKEFEQRLLAERGKILKEMGHLENTVLKVNQRESAGDLSGYSFHMADVGTDAMEREKAFMFASNEGHLLQEIDHALRKVYRGEFGPCENCGRPITRARLEAMPYARLCLACKEEEERANRGAQ
jgi:RNA polymerase-binding protein DksA